jgi:hypothetical protein
MSAIGMILLFVAFLALAGFLFTRYKAGRLANTPYVKTGELAAKGEQVCGEKGAISTEGKVKVAQLIFSPVTKTECLYYKVNVTAKWKEGESDRSQQVMEEKKAADFGLDDGTGAVQVDASKGGDFDLKKVFDKKKGFGLKAVFTGSDTIEFGDHGFQVLPGQKVNGIKIPMSADYQVTEECVLPAESLYVNGKFEAGAVRSPSWVSLIMTAKTREEVMGDTLKTVNRAKMAALICGPLGAVFLAIGALTGGGSSKPATTDTPAPEAPAAEAAPAPAAPAPAPAAPAPAAAPAAEPAAAPAPAPAAPAAPAAGKASKGPGKAGKSKGKMN